MILIDLAHLKSVLRYDPETGYWHAVRPSKHWEVGERVDRDHGNGYLSVYFNKKRYLSHQLAFIYMTGRKASGIDHKDRNEKNNVWNNLREANQSKNLGNTKMRRTNKSGLRGVCWDPKRKRWVAQITINRKQVGLGRFKSKEEAYEVYLKAATAHFGEFFNAA